MKSKQKTLMCPSCGKKQLAIAGSCKNVYDNAIKEGYCVRKNYFRWEVFFRERGKEYDCVGFPSESNALQYLFDKLYGIYVK